MAKSVLIPIALVMVFIIVVGLFTKQGGKLDFLKTSVIQNQEKTVTIGGTVINVEVANTNEKREKGLSKRSSLNQNSGMLFIFDTKPTNASFWMKDMLIPLDMIWIKDAKIISIDENIPAPPADTPNNQLRIYNPGQPIDYVLEVNAGFSASNNIKVGNSVVFNF